MAHHLVVDRFRWNVCESDTWVTCSERSPILLSLRPRRIISEILHINVNVVGIEGPKEFSQSHLLSSKTMGGLSR